MSNQDLMLYNTMTMRKEPFASKGEIRMFVCGPTVQNFIHVGHARTYVFYDLVARYLEHLGHRVNFLINITDIDDRITQEAEKTKESPTELAQRFTKAFLEDVARLKVNSVTEFEPVSKYMQAMIDQVSVLLEKEKAYVADDVVYFDTSTYRDYGKLSHQSTEELAIRPLELTPNKRNLLDFALWRPVRLVEGKWDSPWGRGSPGWHIEDTAVTLTKFGPQYEIHGGAYELIYPHHEAEIAQAESITGVKPFVKWWLHTGLVNVRGRKMSKSAGNTYFVRDLLKQFTADELRFYLLSWRYRDDMEFSLSRLRKAAGTYSKLVRATRAMPLQTTRPSKVKEKLSGFYEAMNDDFDTPRVLEWVTDTVRGIDRGADPSDVASTASALRVASDVLGVDFIGRP